MALMDPALAGLVAGAVFFLVLGILVIFVGDLELKLVFGMIFIFVAVTLGLFAAQAGDVAGIFIALIVALVVNQAIHHFALV